MPIKTERMTIRAFRSDDTADLHEILGDAETMKYSEQPYSFAQTKKFLTEFCIAGNGAFAAALNDSGKVIGYLLFKPLDESVYEIGWFFNRKYWRQGYAYEACSALLTYGFRELKLHKVIAETIDREKSVPLMEKLGTQREGVQRRQVRDNSGNWADLYLYGLLNTDASV